MQQSTVDCKISLKFYGYIYDSVELFKVAKSFIFTKSFFRKEREIKKYLLSLSNCIEPVNVFTLHFCHATYVSNSSIVLMSIVLH